MVELRILMIVNPHSGKKKKDKYYDTIKENLQNYGYVVDTKFTTKEYNATNILEDYTSDYNIIIVCGGDGTLNQVTRALFDMKKKVPLGFIPCGTTNDYARSLKIPFDRLHLSKNINNYISINTDLGVFNEKTFNYAATFGIFSKTSYNVSYKIKNKIGRLAYILSGIKEAFTYKTYKIRVEYEKNKIEDEFIYGSITNSKSIGGFKLFRKYDVKLDDGLFEVVLVKKPKNLLHAVNMFIKIIRGNLEDENIYFFRTEKLKIKSKEKCEWAIDGEYGGSPEEIKIININNELQYIVPKES